MNVCVSVRRYVCMYVVCILTVQVIPFRVERKEKS